MSRNNYLLAAFIILFSLNMVYVIFFILPNAFSPDLPGSLNSSYSNMNESISFKQVHYPGKELSPVTNETQPAQLINIVKNGDFEHPIIPECAGFITYYAGDTINEWIVENNSTDLVHSWSAASGIQSLDLNGISSGAIYQNVNVIPGKRYFLQFYYAGNYDGGGGIREFQVLWGNQILDTIQFNSSGKAGKNMEWTSYQKICYAMNTSTYLGFRDLTPTSGYGGVIDSVQLFQID